MVEELLDSGAIGPEDYGSLKEMLTQQIGMPVEELLKRKDELRRGARVRRHHPHPRASRGADAVCALAAGGGAGAAAPAAAVPPAVEDTSGMTMQVKKLDAFVEGGATNVKVSIKPKAPAADAGGGACAAAAAAAARAAGAGAARAARGARGGPRRRRRLRRCRRRPTRTSRW